MGEGKDLGVTTLCPQDYHPKKLRITLGLMKAYIVPFSS